MRRQRRRAGARTRRSADPEIWYDEPKKPGSKDERWRVSARTGKRERIRPRRAKGSTVNPSLSVKCPRWMEPDCEKCNVCGESADQVSFGITWNEGEELIRQSSAAGGGYRSRGPVLWAMHKLKSDAFELRHLDCQHYAPAYMGGPFAEKAPEYLVWSMRFGSQADLEMAIERARRAKVPDHVLYEIVPPEIAEKAGLIPF